MPSYPCWYLLTISVWQNLDCLTQKPSYLVNSWSYLLGEEVTTQIQLKYLPERISLNLQGGVFATPDTPFMVEQLTMWANFLPPLTQFWDNRCGLVVTLISLNLPKGRRVLKDLPISVLWGFLTLWAWPAFHYCCLAYCSTPLFFSLYDKSLEGVQKSCLVWGSGKIWMWWKGEIWSFFWKLRY